MKLWKATFLLLLFSFVLGHSAVPHHHHVDVPVKKIHDHHEASHHDHDNEEDDHSVFTFSQIDAIFITGKQLTVPILISFIPTVSFTLVVSEEDVTIEYISNDIHRPPLILIPNLTFRGPPSLS
jgi:hypothetical protein